MSLSPARVAANASHSRCALALSPLRFARGCAGCAPPARVAGATGGYHRSPGLRGDAKVVRRSETRAEDAVARIPIEMPKLGYDMETGRVGSWLKKVGDRVTRGEPIAEIETEKSTVEMEATLSGTLAEITAEAGAELPVGEVIGYLDEEG
jgi:multidrug efflux pump subunit AcrA (membrane-fusion protein)